MKIKILLSVISTLLLVSCANMDPNTIGQVADLVLNQSGLGGGAARSGSSLVPSNSEVASGLKESLSLGVKKR